MRTTCKEPDCIKIANYGINKRTHCSSHKSPDAIHTVNICKEHGCKKQSSYSVNGKRTYCSSHKLPNAVRTGNICKEPGCKKQAHYGLDDKRTHCVSHKSPDAVRIGKHKLQSITSSNKRLKLLNIFVDNDDGNTDGYETEYSIG